ncbi:T9SS type A sorting domain-containing protein [candidate division GN15 bacterium]|nr:T9SS type A sorting domain-containing protein [candidate division GN15 bacterium]
MFRKCILVGCILLLVVPVGAAQDGSLWSRNFIPPGVFGPVKAFTQWGDSLVVGGEIVGLNHSNAISRGMVIFDLVDRSWHQESVGSIAVEADVRAAAELPNGDLVIGGDFSFSSNGMTMHHIAVLRKDGSWSTLSGDSLDYCEGSVNALLVHDDRLYIGGEFQSIGDSTLQGPLSFFAIWDESEGFLPTAEEPIGFIELDPSSPPAVHALALVRGDDGDRIYVGGNFVSFPGDVRGGLAVVDVATRVASGFGVLGADGPVYALATSSNTHYDHQLYVGGSFSQAGGINVDNCVMYDHDDSTWHVLGDGLDRPVLAIESGNSGFGTGPMYFAGDSAFFSGTTPLGDVPRWSVNSDEWTASSVSTVGPIYALETTDDGRVAIGGEFEFAGDSSLVDNVFQYDPGAQAGEPILYSLGDGLNRYGTADDVAADVGVDDEGNFYVVGAFSHAGGTLANHVAKWDGTRWSALGDGLEGPAQQVAVDGDTVYVARNNGSDSGVTFVQMTMWDGSQWSDIGSGQIRGSVVEMALDTLGNLIVVGQRLDTAGASSTNGILVWDGMQWSNLGGTLTVATGSPRVWDIYVDSLTNDLYICGRFIEVGGELCLGVARWDGMFWHGLGTAKTGDGTPHVIERSPEGELIITGSIERPEFVTRYRDSIWVSYAGGIATQWKTQLLTVGCHVYLTGEPLVAVGTEEDPIFVNNIARWDGLAWDSLGGGTAGDVYSIAAHGNQLAVAGNFLFAGGHRTNDFAIWNGVVDSEGATDFTVLSPVANDTLEYGTVHRIEWDPATSAELVAVEISLDSGVTWETLHNRAEADRGYLNWLIPDTNAPFCRIRLSDGNQPCAQLELAYTFAITTDSALDVTWLRRKAGTYYIEPFMFGDHSWAFANDSAVCWPEEYWQAFDYTTLPRPLRGIEDRSRFPDWWTFEDGWGEDYCFIRKNTPKIVRPAAYLLWSQLSKRGWDGSCYGFAVSCLLGFRYQEITSEIILHPDRIRELSLNDIWRRTVNKYWSFQFGYKHLIFGLRHFDDTPMETLRLIRDSSMASYQLPRVLSMLSMLLPRSVSDVEAAIEQDIRGHTVVPYRIENLPDSAGIYRIFVYDNNFPNDSSTFIRVDSINSSWSYTPPTSDTDLVWTDTCCGLFTSLSMLEFDDYPTDPATDKSLASTGAQAADSEFVMVMVSGREDMLMTDSAGRQFGAVEGEWYNDDTLSFPIVPLQPDFSGPRPIGYMVPRADYSVELSQLSDTVDMLWQTVDGTFRYRRGDGDSAHTDRLVGGDAGWSITNADNFYKQTDLTLVGGTDDDQYYFQLPNMWVYINDSVNVAPLEDGRIRVYNGSIAKRYDLIMWHTSDTANTFAQTLNILIDSGTTQWVTPQWSNPIDLPLIVENDRDGDMVPDDTIYYNVATSIYDDDTDESLLPRKFSLSQNYPNPFNPTTTIEFSLPVAGPARIDVFNILGQRVTTLIDETLPAGNHETQWHGRDQNGTGVASGVYFYRLTTERYVKTKKMLLLK